MNGRRGKRLLAVALGVAVATLAGLTVLAAACGNDAPPAPPSIATPIGVSPTPSPSPFSSGATTETPVAGPSDLSERSACIGAPPRLERAAATVAATEPPSVPAGFVRGIYSIDRDGGNLQLLTERHYLPPAGGEDPNTYQWSPDGKRIAFLVTDERNRRTVSLLDVKTGSVTSVASPDTVWGFSWSPDGALLAMEAAVGNYEGLYVANLDTGTTTLLFPLQTNDVFIAPDGLRTGSVWL